MLETLATGCNTSDVCSYTGSMKYRHPSSIDAPVGATCRWESDAGRLQIQRQTILCRSNNVRRGSSEVEPSSAGDSTTGQ